MSAVGGAVGYATSQSSFHLLAGQIRFPFFLRSRSAGPDKAWEQDSRSDDADETVCGVVITYGHFFALQIDEY